MAPIRSEQYALGNTPGIGSDLQSRGSSGVKKMGMSACRSPPHPPPDSTASSRPHGHNGGLRVLLSGPSRLRLDVRIIILVLYGGQEIPFHLNSTNPNGAGAEAAAKAAAEGDAILVFSNSLSQSRMS